MILPQSNAINNLVNFYSYLCLIAKRSINIDYRALVCYMLPEGMLDSFEITGFKEEVTQEEDETGTVIKILNRWLEERDLREEVWHDFRPNGFTEYRSFNDFPQWEHNGTNSCGVRRAA